METKNKVSTENIITQSVIGVVVLVCLSIAGFIMAMSYSDKALEREKQTIKHFNDGKIIVCKPDITPISNVAWVYDKELRSFTKDIEIFSAINCSLRK